MKPFISQVAGSTPYDSTGEIFQAEDVQGVGGELSNIYYNILKEPTGFLDRDSSTIQFDNTTRTFTIAPKNEQFEYWIRGVRYSVVSPLSVVLPNTAGTYFIYFANTNLTASTSVPSSLLSDVAYISYIYWNATTQEAILFGEERHGLRMDAASHEYHHKTRGTVVQGIAPYRVVEGNVNGSLDSHAQIYTTSGKIFDEDIEVEVTDMTSPQGYFDQTLSPYTKLPIFYLEGTEIRSSGMLDYLAINDGGGTAFYNYFNPSTSQWELKRVTEGYCYQVWICAGLEVNNPIFGILGRLENATPLGLYEAENKDTFDFSAFPIQEYQVIGVISLRSSISYTNTPKVKIEKSIDPNIYKAKNDRYAITAWKNGNTGVGKYLDLVEGTSSQDAPFLFPENSYIRTITLTCSRISTGTLNFYISGSSTPRYSITFNNQRSITLHEELFFAQEEELILQVTSGRLKDPVLRFWVQTDTL